MRLTLEAMHSFPQRAVLTEDILCSQNPGTSTMRRSVP